MTDIAYKTIYSPEEIEQKKQIYLEKKKAFLDYLKEIETLLENAGDTPFTGDVRQTIMMKFDTLDRRLLDGLDIASFQYFEAKEAPQKV